MGSISILLKPRAAVKSGIPFHNMSKIGVNHVPVSYRIDSYCLTILIFKEKQLPQVTKQLPLGYVFDVSPSGYLGLNIYSFACLHNNNMQTEYVDFCPHLSISCMHSEADVARCDGERRD